MNPLCFMFDSNALKPRERSSLAIAAGLSRMTASSSSRVQLPPRAASSSRTNSYSETTLAAAGPLTGASDVRSATFVIVKAAVGRVRCLNLEGAVTDVECFSHLICCGMEEIVARMAVRNE